MIKEYVSGKSAENVVFKKDRINNFTFDLATEVISINVSPRLVLAHGEEREQATVSHALTSVPAPSPSPNMFAPYGNAIQVPESAITAFNTLKTEIANKVAKFYEDHILTVEEV